MCISAVNQMIYCHDTFVCQHSGGFERRILEHLNNFNKYEHHCGHDVTLGCHASYRRRHVVLSTVSLAGVYASSRSRLSPACKRC